MTAAGAAPAARGMFADEGLGAATARRSDLAARTFYNYLDDKDELLPALLCALARG